ncbi:hypothetical protein THAOC_02310 [Thalassiosira oceanica]|uniref:Uncharacterized protein n=1 Tax=Thalassiosira oceanica TaxID=159749 RepID=K0TQF3_THAOC|nr:hypothetical protein THAOC_02310 [Thalassiosira oceanica]|eukprot:EJK75947.1 hypothetical protein THAOC_02310 [Thalassiosira oceanica]
MGVGDENRIAHKRNKPPPNSQLEEVVKKPGAVLSHFVATMTNWKALLFVLIGGAVGARARAPRATGPAPKPLDLINEKVIDAAIASHSAFAEQAEDFTRESNRGSNDDPLYLNELQLTVMIDGTLFTMSPLSSSGADSPTFSPSYVGSYSPIGNSELIVSNAVVADGTSPDPSTHAERQPSDGAVEEGASATPTYLPTIISNGKQWRSTPTYYPTSIGSENGFDMKVVATDGTSAPPSSMLEETHDTFDTTENENEDNGFANAISDTPENASTSVQVGDGSEPTSSTNQAVSERNNSTSTPSVAPHTEGPTSFMALDETQSSPAEDVSFINKSPNISKSSNSSVMEHNSTIESAPEAGESLDAHSDVAASPSPGGTSSLEGSTLVEHQDITEPTSMQVKLPRIICDISISKSLLERFEQKKALLSTMEITVNQIVRTYLPSLYKYLGVAFDVQVIEDGQNLESPLLRLHAFFSGTASFSLQGAPTEQEITKLLLVHFDVDAFNQSLRAPLRDRRLTALVLAPHDGDTVVKVNSVFFKVDGSLVLAGSMFDQVPSTTTSLTKPGDKGQTVYALTFFVLVGKQEVNSTHLRLVLSLIFVITAAKCFMGLVAIFIIKNRLTEKDGDISEPEPPYDEDISHFAERGESVAQQSALEIVIIPQTPTISDISESQASSLMVSPYTNDQSPSSSSSSQAHYRTPNSLIGLGIKHPSSRNYYQEGLSRRTLGFSSADHQEWTPYDIYADVPSPCSKHRG